MKDHAGIEIVLGEPIVIDWQNNFLVRAIVVTETTVVADDPEELWSKPFRRAVVLDADSEEEIPHVARCDRLTGQLTRFWPLPVEFDPETEQPKQITETRKFKIVLR